uniref:Uncharacterized protein n=1 Tax=Solanum lycopersicum TaxID=4081 RepID=A0A3Q7FTJ1_SOLLC
MALLLWLKSSRICPLTPHQASPGPQSSSMSTAFSQNFFLLALILPSSLSLKQLWPPPGMKFENMSCKSKKSHHDFPNKN